MRRSQWFVLGIGLVIISFYISILSGMQDCSRMHGDSLKTVENAIDSKLDTEVIQMFQSTSDAWAISCFEMFDHNATISSILFSLGIIFIIFGFLEPKTKKRK